MGHMKNYSEATAIEIDNEISRIVKEAYQRTRKILDENKNRLIDVADALLEKENLDGAEIRKMVFGEEAVSQPAAAGGVVAPGAGSCVEETNTAAE